MGKQIAGYRNLAQADRDRMEALLDAREKQKGVAKILKVDPGTISPMTIGGVSSE